MSTGIPQHRHHATAMLGIVMAMSLERGCLPRTGWRAELQEAGSAHGTAQAIPALRRASLGDMELLCAVSGPGPEAARRAAEGLVRRGARALLCVGVSGGLSPALSSGDLVLAEAVLVGGQDRRIPITSAWADQALIALRAAASSPGRHPRISYGPVLSLDRPALGVARKEDLWRRTRALVVDQESAGTAAVAAEAGLPLLVLRAVCDPAERDLPPELPALIDARGRVRPRRLLRNLAHRPALILDLISSRRDFSAAMAALGWAMNALCGGDALRPPAG